MRNLFGSSRGGKMKSKTAVISALVFGLILSLLSTPGMAVQKKKKDAKSEIVIIPKEVKAIIVEGIKTREARPDIPITIVKHLYLPARENIHSIFLFKVKNADLGFEPVTPAQAPQGQEQEEQQEAESAPEAAPAMLKAHAHLFLQFNKLDGDFEKEIYVPVDLEVEADSYDPEKEDIYTTGFPLAAGKYLLSLAIASQKLEKIGTQYLEFSLPDQMSFTENLDTTPVFFCKKINQMSAPETKVNIHKGYFTYSILQFDPNLDNVFSAGDNLDIFFFIFGARPDANGAYSIEVNYEVDKDGEKVIRYAPTTYNSPLVSQPLPLKKTVVITTQKEGQEKEERKETQDLETGSFTLSISIKDNITGLSLVKTVDFEVR